MNKYFFFMHALSHKVILKVACCLPFGMLLLVDAHSLWCKTNGALPPQSPLSKKQALAPHTHTLT
jgi:hypothetical protein